MHSTVKVVCYRSDGPGTSERFQEYQVPVEKETSLYNLLMFISENLDPTLAFFKHAACKQGLCSRCAVKLNGKVCLACTEPVSAQAGTVTVEPINKNRVLRDLVCVSGGA